MARITGTKRADTLRGTALADSIFGLGGDDRLFGQAGADKLYGGSGNDKLYGDSGDDRIFGDSGADALRGDSGDDTLDGGTGDDALSGGTGADKLKGGNGNDTLIGGAGADSFSGGSGFDIVTYTAETVALSFDLDLHAGPGGDTFDASIEKIIGSKQSDIFNLGIYSGGPSLDAGAGTDLLNISSYTAPGTGSLVINLTTGLLSLSSAAVPSISVLGIENASFGDATALPGAAAWIVTDSAVNNVISGGAATDTFILINAADADTITDNRFAASGAGYDTLDFHLIMGTLTLDLSTNSFTGGALNDTFLGLFEAVIGNDGGDTLTGNDGANSLTGGAGEDIIDGGLGADAMSGGGGNDLYYVDDPGDTIADSAGSDQEISSITITLATGIEKGLLLEFGALDLTGNSLDNTLIGNSSNNVIGGDAGADVIDGKGGIDTLTGGAGADQFFFHDSNGQDDTVTDFVQGTDFIALDPTEVLFDIISDGTNLFNVASIGGPTGSTASQLIFETSTGKLYLDIDGDDPNDSPFVIGTLTGVGANVTAADFTFIL